MVFPFFSVQAGLSGLQPLRLVPVLSAQGFTPAEERGQSGPDPLYGMKFIV